MWVLTKKFKIPVQGETDGVVPTPLVHYALQSGMPCFSGKQHRPKGAVFRSERRCLSLIGPNKSAKKRVSNLYSAATFRLISHSLEALLRVRLNDFCAAFVWGFWCRTIRYASGWFVWSQYMASLLLD
jgi:hypothetical protein